MIDFIEFAKEVFVNEIDGINSTMDNLDESFNFAIDMIFQCKGKVVVCGMGKSGIIGKKLAASLSSTGTPSFFLHPAEAFHGDLGMISENDLFITISNSGETEEILRIIPFLKNNNIISLTSNRDSTLALNSNCNLIVKIPSEACPLQLAPTTSTTSTLVLCDALVLSVMNKKNFKDSDFARFHPGGSLGKRLLNSVGDEMEVDFKVLDYQTDFKKLVLSLTQSKIGMVLYKNTESKFGIITDGDLRRALELYGDDVFHIDVKDIVNFNPKSIKENCKYTDALNIMENLNITSLLVYNFDDEIVGILKK